MASQMSVRFEGVCDHVDVDGEDGTGYLRGRPTGRGGGEASAVGAVVGVMERFVGDGEDSGNRFGWLRVDTIFEYRSRCKR